MSTNEERLALVEAFCRREGLLTGEKIAAAVSGGADSMALLRTLLALQPRFGYEVCACHVNHGLRGETADRDEAFVRDACARLGVPLRVFHPAELGPDYAVPSHAGEDWARRLRYACFERLCAEDGRISAVVTAHTGTDQAETLLFRLARGTGLHGAAGIRPQRGRYMRPLLCLTRADTEALCRGFGESWVDDETNAADDYARNRLRHAALPALRAANEAAERNLARFCEAAARADAYFARKADELLAAAHADACAESRPSAARRVCEAGGQVWALATLRTADAEILSAALHSLVSPVRDAEEKYIRLLAGLVEGGSGAVQLTDTVRFCAREGLLWREDGPQPTPRQADDAPTECAFLPADGAEYRLAGGWRVKTRLVSGLFREKTQDVHKKDLKNQADYARITTLYPVLVLRCRQPGDRYRPAGRGVNRELRKWMNEAGIPPTVRAQLPVLACGSEIVWVCGAGFADGLAPQPGCAQVIELEAKQTEEVEP